MSEPRLDALLPFGIHFGDATFPTTLDGAAGPINFNCTFYGTSEEILYVSLITGNKQVSLDGYVDLCAFSIGECKWGAFVQKLFQ